MTSHLKNGNSKLHKILIFDLPTGSTCLNSKACYKTCYARKAEWRFPATRAHRAKNLALSKNADLFEKTICDELKRTRQKFVRIHSS